MATTYYLTTTGEATCSLPGDNFDNTMTASAPGTTTLAITVTTNTTETDAGFSDTVGTDGGSGTQAYTVRVAINTGNADLECSVQLARINSGCAVQNSSGFSSEQTANTGTLVFSFGALDLGTWAAGDRLRLEIAMRDTTTHGNENLTYDIGGSGVRVDAPWTISGGGPSPGLRTLGLTGAGL